LNRCGGKLAAYRGRSRRRRHVGGEHWTSPERITADVLSRRCDGRIQRRRNQRMIPRHSRRGRNHRRCQGRGHQCVIARDIRCGWNHRRVETGRCKRLVTRDRGCGSDHRIKPDSVPGVIANDVRSRRDKSRGQIRRRAYRAQSFRRWWTSIRPDRQ